MPPFTGAWVEIFLPMRIFLVIRIDAPLVGAWVEIQCPGNWHQKQVGCPIVGAWVEMMA